PNLDELRPLNAVSVINRQARDVDGVALQRAHDHDCLPTCLPGAPHQFRFPVDTVDAADVQAEGLAASGDGSDRNGRTTFQFVVAEHSTDLDKPHIVDVVPVLHRRPGDLRRCGRSYKADRGHDECKQFPHDNPPLYQWPWAGKQVDGAVCRRCTTWLDVRQACAW